MQAPVTSGPWVLTSPAQLLVYSCGCQDIIQDDPDDPGSAFSIPGFTGPRCTRHGGDLPPRD